MHNRNNSDESKQYSFSSHFNRRDSIRTKKSTGSWRKVSELLKHADVRFGFGTDEMKQILDQTDISKSKASKLISNAQDDRIRQNPSIFDTVSAWTTLYQATLLNNDKFTKLNFKTHRRIVS